MSCGDRLAEELRTRNYRVTPQRAVILETIAHLPGHRKVNEVYEISRTRLPGLNLATVYRTLETLHEAEMVDLFFQEGESLQFALRDPTHPHGHLFCQCCGKMIELDLTVLESARDTIWQQYGFRLESDHISLRGQCDECLGDSQKIGGK